MTDTLPGSGGPSDSLALRVHAGDLARPRSLVVATVPRSAMHAAGAGPRGPVGGQWEYSACLLREGEGDSSDAATPVVAQYDPWHEQLTFVYPSTLGPGEERRFAVIPAEDATVRAAAPLSVTLIQKLDRVTFQVGGEPFATYTVLGNRRPYFWPVLGPAGASLVRGQGTGDHPHHTGMGIAYGGHSEDGSVNIWSDWDEPPYGPCGRMVHRGFRRAASGPVFGEVVQDLTYLDAYGDPVAEEVRTIRAWWASPVERFLDVRCDVVAVRDRGSRPFLFAIRLPEFLGIPTAGRVTNSAGFPVPPPKGERHHYRAAWVDASGPTGAPPAAPPAGPPEVLVDLPGYVPPKRGIGEGPWNGIALFDHPSNDGFPGTIGKYAGSRGAVQLTQAHYPPAAAPDGPFSFSQRVFVHDGDAGSAGVAARAAEYGRPCTVTVEGVVNR